jgi:DNA-binding IclR family transcriptional regulator
MKHLPQITVPHLAKALSMAAPTARSALNHLKDLGVLEEISGKKRDKVYLYRNYLALLEAGAKPLPPGHGNGDDRRHS